MSIVKHLTIFRLLYKKEIQGEQLILQSQAQDEFDLAVLLLFYLT